MNGLRILGGDNASIQWIFRGQHGQSVVTPQGVVQMAVLTAQEFFDLLPTVGAQIIQECQTWHDQQQGSHTGPARFKVQVQQDAGGYHNYSVLAHNLNAAIMLAFALDGGINTDPAGVTRLEAGHLELAKEYCEIIE